MLRGRWSTTVVGMALAVAVPVGCSDDGPTADEVTREQGLAILTGQGYTTAAAECVIDRADDQDVDVLDVFGRDQVTQRELQVLAAVQEFCLEQFGGTTTTSRAPVPE
jgi:hypothetical protein